MRVIRVEVTQADIDKGIQSSASACPVARALRRHYPDALVLTGRWFPTQALFSLREGDHPLPETVSVLIRQFDAGHPIHPFSFVIGEMPS